ncbi:MAG: hypothetical protein JWN32_4335 [Solirubrobacterales bacterium]|nr:hypothetical protein [Solirubrobacterales bacterium]
MRWAFILARSLVSAPPALSETRQEPETQLKSGTSWGGHGDNIPYAFKVSVTVDRVSRPA